MGVSFLSCSLSIELRSCPLMFLNILITCVTLFIVLVFSFELDRDLDPSAAGGSADDCCTLGNSLPFSFDKYFPPALMLGPDDTISVSLGVVLGLVDVMGSETEMLGWAMLPSAMLIGEGMYLALALLGYLGVLKT